MLNTQTVSIDELRSNLADIVNRVTYANDRIVVKKHNREAAIIISLDEYEQLVDKIIGEEVIAVRVEKKKALRNIQSTRNLLGLAGIIPKGSGLPADLSAKHNEYTWD